MKKFLMITILLISTSSLADYRVSVVDEACAIEKIVGARNTCAIQTDPLACCLTELQKACPMWDSEGVAAQCGQWFPPGKPSPVPLPAPLNAIAI